MTWDHPTVSTLRARNLWPPTAHQQHGDGPTRVVTDQPDADFKARPVGFAPAPRHRADVPVDSTSAALGPDPDPLLLRTTLFDPHACFGSHRREVDGG